MIHRESQSKASDRFFSRPPRFSFCIPGCSSHTSIFPFSEPSGGASGQATDISIHAKEILRIRESLTNMYAEHCTLEGKGEAREDARGRFGEFLHSGRDGSGGEAGNVTSGRGVTMDRRTLRACTRQCVHSCSVVMLSSPSPPLKRHHAISHACSSLHLERALERDHFMTAQEALDFGIVDKIVERRGKGADGEKGKEKDGESGKDGRKKAGSGRSSEGAGMP